VKLLLTPVVLWFSICSLPVVLRCCRARRPRPVGVFISWCDVTAKLELKFDGEVTGLKQSRLDFDVWLTPLDTLQKAIRRVGQRLLADDADAAFGTRGGRYGAAERISLSLSQIDPGSLGLQIDVDLLEPTDQAVLIEDDLHIRAVDGFLEELDSGAQDPLVQKYLSTLPAGLSHQEYRLEQDGVVLREASVKSFTVHEGESEFPRLLLVEAASVVSVGFEPGKTSVGLRHDGRTTVADASPEQVEQALSLRSAAVSAAILVGKSARVVWLRDGVLPSRDSEAVIERIGERWSDVLARLAE